MFNKDVIFKKISISDCLNPLMQKLRVWRTEHIHSTDKFKNHNITEINEIGVSIPVGSKDSGPKIEPRSPKWSLLTLMVL